MKNIKKLETDVLVVGGGLAGCWAAIGAKEVVDRVTLVDKAVVAKSGCSTFAAGVMLAPLSDDDLEEWAREVVENGEYMNDQDWVTLVLQEQMERLAQMEAWGFAFEREADGRIARVVGKAHKKTRVLMFHGPKLMEGMRKQVLARGVDLKERIMVTDLLLQEGQLAGALGYHTRAGKWVIFNAKAVILSCGHIGLPVGGGYVDNMTGDGAAMAYRAGAVLTDMEFGTQCNINTWRRQYRAGGINMIQGHGALIINAQGERFMAKYDPALKERSRTCVLGPAFVKEVLEGRGPIYVDMRHLKSEAFEKFWRVIPKNMRVFKEAGIDLTREVIECTPSVQTPYSETGGCGIRVDLCCRTNISGLFAAGSVSKIRAHGTYSVGGLNLAYCCVSGYRAGHEGGKFANATLSRPPSGDVQDYISGHEQVPARSPIDSEEIIREIKMVTVPARYGFFKHARRINETLTRLAEIEAELMPRVEVNGPHGRVKAMGIQNYLSCARLAYQASLVREESRGNHFREEYPNRDDRNWLKWITVKRVQQQDSWEMEPVPLERYPIKPKELVPIPYPVQYFFEK